MRRLAAVLAAVLACGCSAPPAAVAGHPLPPGRFTTGAAARTGAAFQAATGVRPGIVEHYTTPGSPFSPRFAGGAVPLIQVMPYGVPLGAFTSGREDGWLRSYASAVAAWRAPVILGFAPEMNGDWYGWGLRHVTPAAYVAAWRHVVRVFRSAGAGNVTWLWTVNVEDIGPSGGGRVSSAALWWPGAAWVTWTGVDGYYYSAAEGFADVFGATLAAVRPLGRPVLISETAVASGAGKAAKIPGLFAGARAAGLLGLVWFDLPGNRDWKLDGDPAALAAFRAAARKYG